MAIDITNLYGMLSGLSRHEGVVLEGRPVVTAAFARALAAAMLYPGELGQPFLSGRDTSLIIRGLHPDVTEVVGEKSGTISVEEARAIQRMAQIKPNQAPGRVFIIPDAAAMKAPAQNAMLKTLEEPPKGVRFILAVENRHNLLLTVQSRMVIIPLDGVAAPFPKSFDECMEQIAALVPDWERVVELMGEKAAGRLFADCDKALAAICSGDLYSLLAAFAAYEKKREDFIRFCSSLRSVCSRRLIMEGGSVPRLQAAAETLMLACEYAGQNVFLPMLGSYAAGLIMR